MLWRRRIIGFAIAILLLVFAGVLISGAIVISRMNSLIAKSDASLEAQGLVGDWRSFLGYDINRWLVEQMGQGDGLKLRNVYVLLAENQTEAAVNQLQELANSKNHQIASIALNELGIITASQALSNQDSQLLERALQLFAKASVLDPENENAKHNLEFLSSLRNSEGKSQDSGQNKQDNGDLPLDTLPGIPGGNPGKYSDY